jgi:DNA-binding SARP family transcriptional activator
MGGATMAAPAHLVVRVLGDVAVEDDSGCRPVPGDKPRHLVALVALAGRPISADEVADRLWPGLELEVARRRLRNVVSRVRAVGPVVEREADRLRLAPGVVVDAERFTTTAERVLARHEPDPVARQITEARAALTLWGGPLAVPGDAGGLDLAAARLDRLHAGLLDRVVSASVRAGDTDGAVAALEELAAADPYNDDFAERAASLLRAAGRPVEAARFERLAAATRAALVD